MMRWIAIAITLALPVTAAADEFRHVGDFLLKSHFKLTGEKITPIPMKTLAFRVYTDGVRIKVAAEGDDESHSLFEIYRSDGIGRQRSGGGALEVIPGLQASSQTGGVLRHLRLSRESMTITTFPGVSDQTIVSHAVAAEPTPRGNASTTTPQPSP
jgi:hypothetical protein